MIDRVFELRFQNFILIWSLAALDGSCKKLRKIQSFFLTKVSTTVSLLFLKLSNILRASYILMLVKNMPWRKIV